MAEISSRVVSEHSSHKEHVLSRFKSSYMIRKLKNKGAIITLIWNFFVVGVSEYLIAYVKIRGGASIGTIFWASPYPSLGGWLMYILDGTR